ncbi:type IV pilin protein [Diaphorobacter aerolatus]|uniref:Type IV pilin protein n=1 Tax=Diaphorobacter aerolatus TaxID=1288495 RepID=A0A7H0GGA5_9BURK|nr:type IV pilin protein [Diaphorobacter aerolatus]QNP47321.1 type IV pilin protein [Diaphorobacter aerolatus]
MKQATVRLRRNGFTLIEMMIVLAVIAILAAVATPSYRQHLARGHRAEARAALLQVAQWMERANTANGEYPTGQPLEPMLRALKPAHYTLSLTASTASGFTVIATRTDVMVKDPCGDLTLTHTGTRGASNHSVSNVAKECWAR